ncbi:D-ribose pyranase [Acetoanaerobium pronyense]|uniref:D-ribose pyranase n=1 Tax=Acetoanaerobium pronyense TaxID=1482736 RepID=A0ABS4KKI1_9FIRM|nr:D-ribose pyranase [Acetoanaerobium pronyense]MBP2028308.1 D-ribose pyranase [Acetoanaerobium pronyense]
MKKTKLINSELSYEISKLGHTDEITVADCGLPIPKDINRIDLALVRGIPTFKDTLEAILLEMEVEEIVLAEEIKENNSEILDFIKEKLGDKKVNFISHEEFKKRTLHSKTIVRTGEASPYANVILKSGVAF